MRRTVAGSLIGLVSIMLALHPVAAQRPSRSSFWLGAGFGTANADLSCNICVDDSKGVLSGYLRAGFTIHPHLLAGVEATMTHNSEDGIAERFTGLAAALYAYPWSNGIYFKGGVGIMDYNAHDDTDEFSTRAVALHLGTGYEFRVAPHFSVGPFANLIVTTNGDLDFNGSRVTGDASMTLLHVGVGVTMH
jgi:outer membrane protein with beta-barrel domain